MSTHKTTSTTPRAETSAGGDDPMAPHDAASPAPPPGETVPISTLRKVTAAAAAGTVVEWFDFAIYGFMAPMIAAAFFPSGSQVVSLLQTFAVFAVAFALRPIGGAFFGSLGDKIGRKKVLALTVLLMSVATAAIGVLPAYEVLGVWAALLLTLARCLQGLSAGGEYAGATAYVIEHAPAHKRSFYSSAMPAATFGSFAAAAGISWLLSVWFGADALNDWAWRIPFLIAVPLGLVAFYIRAKLDESPAFAKVVAEKRDDHAPLRATLRREWKPMAVLAGYISLTGLSFYIFSTYMTTFLREVVHMGTDAVLLSNLLALLAAACMAPVMGLICDRVGRKPLMYASALLLGCLAIPSYLLAGAGTFSSALISQIALAVGAVAANVVTAVLLSEVFPTVSRYTASAVTYNVSYAIFGGTAPFVATFLIDITGLEISPAIYLTLIAALSVIAIRMLPETRGRDLDDRTELTNASHASPSGTV